MDSDKIRSRYVLLLGPAAHADKSKAAKPPIRRRPLLGAAPPGPMRRFMVLSESVGNLPDPALLAGFVPRGEEDAIARHLLRPEFSYEQETALLLAFDSFGRLLAVERAGSDGTDRCRISARSWRGMLQTGGTGAVMAHNHPSGAPWPSEADLIATREAANLLRLLGIGLIDHLIFVGDGHFSFRKAGLL